MQKLTDKKDEKDKNQAIELPKNIREKLKAEAEKLVIKLEDEFIEIEDVKSTKESKDSNDKNDQENSKNKKLISTIPLFMRILIIFFLIRNSRKKTKT